MFEFLWAKKATNIRAYVIFSIDLINIDDNKALKYLNMIKNQSL